MAVKGKSKDEILAAFEARLDNDAAAEIGDRACRDRPHRRAAHRRTSCRERDARIIRGRLLSFHDDPRLAGARALSLIDERRHARSRAAGSPRSAKRATIARARAAGAAIDDHSRQAHPARASSTRISIIRRRASSAPMARSCSTGCRNTHSSRSRNSPIPRTPTSVARFFLDELFRQGTTTAMVYCTVHPQSVDAFFAEAERRGARMIAGKVMMDRNAPAALTDTAAARL